MNIVISIIIPAMVSVVVNTLYKAINDKKAYEMQMRIEELEKQMVKVCNGLQELIDTLDDFHALLAGMRDD